MSSVVTAKPDLDRLYADWRRLGVNFTGRSSAEPVDVERLIVATASVGGADERLTVCVASWLACYHALVDGRRLVELTRAVPDEVLPYLGVLLSLAVEAPEGAGRALQFEAALAHCRPLRAPRAFYNVIESSPALREWMRTHALPLYRHWGLWHDDMKLKRSSVHALAWLLKVPELRARALNPPDRSDETFAMAVRLFEHHSLNPRS